MERLIDADALKKAIPETTVDASTKYRYCVTFEREDVLAIIDAAPTVDIDSPTRSQFKRMAVQLGYERVVHCRDCKFSRELNEIEKKAYLDECRACVCLEASQYGYMIVFPGHYCSYGERRTDEQ